MYDLNLYNVVKEIDNLDIFLNTSVRKVETGPIDNDAKYEKKILSIYANQLGSEKELIFYARQYADCTGDGTIGYLAGAEYRYGREARSEFNEKLALDESDDQVMGSTISLLARDTGQPAPYNPPGWAKKYKTEEELGLCRSIGSIGTDEYSGFWWLELSNPFHTVKDYNSIRDELLKHLLGVWDYIKNYS